MGRIIRLDERDDYDKLHGRMVRRSEFDDHDPLTGITERFYYDPETGDVGVEYVTDVQAIVDINKAQYADVDSKARWTGVMNHVARIPGVFLHFKPELLFDDKELKRWLNDPDNRCFRTRPGRI